MAGPPKIHALESLVLAALFAVGICLPVAWQFTVGERDFTSVEKRQPAPFPAFSGNWKLLVKFFPQELDNYFSDHFGLRRLLLKANGFISLHWFHVSNWVIVGNNDWLFYKIYPPLFYHTLDAPKFAQWKSYIGGRQRWLAARGVKYLFVITPEKACIYPEFLPLSAGRRPAELASDQLVRYIRENVPGVNIIYLRESLLAAKKLEHEPLYYKQDTHWNSLGAYYGYEEIIRNLANWYPVLRPKPRSGYSMGLAPDHMRDLAAQAGISDSPALSGPVLQPLTPSRTETYRLPPLGFTGLYFATQAKNPPNLPRAVMLRDSFTIALAPYLSEHFSRITYFWPSLDLHIKLDQEKIMAATVVKDKADVFIEEHVERFLIDPPNDKIVFGGGNELAPP